VKEIFCCIDHSDIAIDDFVNENETFPIMEISEANKCGYCMCAAAYVLKLPADHNIAEAGNQKRSNDQGEID